MSPATTNLLSAAKAGAVNGTDSNASSSLVTNSMQGTSYGDYNPMQMISQAYDNYGTTQRALPQIEEEDSMTVEKGGTVIEAGMLDDMVNAERQYNVN